MSPTQFAAALRDFAAAVTLTDPNVGALALLIAQGVEPAPTAHAGADDEPEFPPLEEFPGPRSDDAPGEKVYTIGFAGVEYTEAQVADLARAAADLTTEAWEALPAEEKTLHIDLQLSKLFQKHFDDKPADQAVDHQPV